MRSFLCFRFFLFWTKCGWSTRVCTLRCGLSLFFLFPFYLWYATLFFFSCWSVSSSFFFFSIAMKMKVYISVPLTKRYAQPLWSLFNVTTKTNIYIYIYMLFYLYVYISVRCFFFLICACAHGIWKLRFSFFFFSLLCDSLCYIGPIELFLVFAGNDSFNFSHWSFALQPTKTSFFYYYCGFTRKVSFFFFSLYYHFVQLRG